MYAWIWRTFRLGRIGALCGSLICGSPRVSTGATRMQQASLPSLHSRLLPALLLVSVAAWPSFGAERTAADAWPAASAVLQRFITSQEKTSCLPSLQRAEQRRQDRGQAAR